MITLYMPWMLSAISVFQMWMVGNLNRWSWVVGLCNQLLWLLWIVSAEQWGFMPLNVALWIVYARNHVVWQRSRLQEESKVEEIVKTLRREP